MQNGELSTKNEKIEMRVSDEEEVPNF